MYKHIFLLIVFWVILPPLSAQEHYAFSPIDSNDGLSGNHILGLKQLHDDRMVIITEGLVNLYMARLLIISILTTNILNFFRTCLNFAC